MNIFSDLVTLELFELTWIWIYLSKHWWELHVVFYWICCESDHRLWQWWQVWLDATRQVVYCILFFFFLFFLWKSGLWWQQTWLYFCCDSRHSQKDLMSFSTIFLCPFYPWLWFTIWYKANSGTLTLWCLYSRSKISTQPVIGQNEGCVIL